MPERTQEEADVVLIAGWNEIHAQLPESIKELVNPVEEGSQRYIDMQKLRGELLEKYGEDKWAEIIKGRANKLAEELELTSN
ncbi:MAG: hypothetical protein ABII07_04595 [Patescibacteria group bacterium]|nr:hypothetical protein [Patescibacteria group bacterium]